MTGQHLLEQFPVVRTQSADELRADVMRLAGARNFDVRLADGRLDARVNQCKLHDTSFLYTTFGAPVRIEFPGVDFVRVQLVLRGNAAAVVQGRQIMAAPGECWTISSNEELIQNDSADFAHVMLRIGSDALIAKLGALIGAQPKGPLRFHEPAGFVGEQERLRRFVLYLVHELDVGQSHLHALALAEMEQVLMVAFLCGNRHNFSDLLDREPQGIAPWQVRRAEEFIAANWNQPITIEGLANAVGASVRTIFRCFKQSRGFGPMVFVKQLRLDHAREFLNRGDADTTVTGTALSCGFHNIGHFAVDYRRAFGELPSETLNRAMGRNYVAERKASRPPNATPTSS
ncbi:MAG: AraC family transcriptional regulator [Xanthobacteraceae bacterium]